VCVCVWAEGCDVIDRMVTQPVPGRPASGHRRATAAASYTLACFWSCCQCVSVPFTDQASLVLTVHSTPAQPRLGYPPSPPPQGPPSVEKAVVSIDHWPLSSLVHWRLREFHLHTCLVYAVTLSTSGHSTIHLAWSAACCAVISALLLSSCTLSVCLSVCLFFRLLHSGGHVPQRS